MAHGILSPFPTLGITLRMTVSLQVNFQNLRVTPNAYCFKTAQNNLLLIFSTLSNENKLDPFISIKIDT